jgi:hypothetical protein
MRVLYRAAVRGLVLLGVLAGALVCVSAPALAESAGTCPNAQLRTGLSANLPDCRAYELVNPGTRDTAPFAGSDYAFADGEHVYMSQLLPMAGARNGVLSAQAYLSTRGSAGWTMASLSTPQGPSLPEAVEFLDGGGELIDPSFTSDFSAAFVNSPFATDPLDQDLGVNVYRVGIPGGASSLASLPDTGPITESLVGGSAVGGAMPGAYVAGSSADGSHVFFDTQGRLPTAPGTPFDTQDRSETGEVYDRTGGHTYLVGVLPDGSVPACGAEVGQGPKSSYSEGAYLSYGAISPDGSNVVFASKCLSGETSHTDTLYLREDNARTVMLPGLHFGGRTADGSKILTLGDSSADLLGPIYEYDIASGQTTTIGRGELLGFSADGSHVYYHAPGEESGVYLWNDGVTTLIPGTDTPLQGNHPEGVRPDGYPSDSGAISNVDVSSARLIDLPAVTPDGSKMVFVDYTNVTSYNSHIRSEVYLYDANTNSVTCISCNPNAISESEQSEAPIALGQYHPYDPFVPPYVPVISNDGSRIFFETGEALVPQDTNGLLDVYEWHDGHISLLSSGQGSLASFLVGVGDNGNDVFIRTADRLVGQVEDNIAHIYDARVDGGFPYTPPVYGCESETCQGSPSAPPVFAAPGSSVFSGPGNPSPPQPVTSSTPKGKAKKVVKCAKGRQLSHGKCVKVKARKKAKGSARNARSDRARSDKGGK